MTPPRAVSGARLDPRRLGTIGCVLALMALGGCDKIPFLSDESEDVDPIAAIAEATEVVPPKPRLMELDVVAKVNGTSISRKDVEIRVLELKFQALAFNPEMEWDPLSQEELELVLEELISAELMTQDAMANDLHQATPAQHRWTGTRRGFFANEWLRWSQDRMVQSSEIERYYEENKPNFREPERIKVRQLTVASVDEAKRALAQLHGASVDFSTLARQISIGATAAQGGMVRGWVMRAVDKTALYGTEGEAAKAKVYSLDPILQASAFAIDQLDGISGYVRGADNRFHIFQLAERQEGRLFSLSDVWDGIKAALLTEKIQQAVDELESSAQIQRFPGRLADVSQEEELL